MKALTLWQPWATLIALGHKRIETRHWSTSHRGLLAIHAGRTVDRNAIAAFTDMGLLPEGEPIPTAQVLAIAELTDVLVITDGSPMRGRIEEACGYFKPGRYAWMLGSVIPLAEPVPALGKQGLWTWEDRSP